MGMSGKITRRGFLRSSSLVAAVAGAAGATTTAKAQRQPSPSAWRGDRRVRQVAINCEMCFWRCGIMAEVADGKVLKIRGDPHHPFTKGKLCARGNAGTQLLYDPDRLKYPMLRTGPRGSGKFTRTPGMRRSTFSLPG